MLLEKVVSSDAVIKGKQHCNPPALCPRDRVEAVGDLITNSLDSRRRDWAVVCAFRRQCHLASSSIIRFELIPPLIRRMHQSPARSLPTALCWQELPVCNELAMLREVLLSINVAYC
jgi:hypothetical protein